MTGGRRSIWFLALAALWIIYSLGHAHPFAYLVMGTFLPLPLVLAARRLEVLACLGLVLAMTALIVLRQPGLAGLSENLGVWSLLWLGLVLGVLQVRLKWPATAILLAVAILTLGTLLFFIGQALLLDISLQDLWSQRADDIAQTIYGLLGTAGGGDKGLQVLGLPAFDWHHLVKQVLPALVVINTGFVAWINLVLARQAAWWLGWGEPHPPLWEWSSPEWLIFLFLGAGFLLFMPFAATSFISINLLLILAFVYFGQGVAVIAAMLQRFQIPRILRGLSYPLLFLNPLFFLVVIVGLMDLWLDFRRLHQPRDA